MRSKDEQQERQYKSVWDDFVKIHSEMDDYERILKEPLKYFSINLLGIKYIEGAPGCYLDHHKDFSDLKETELIIPKDKYKKPLHPLHLLWALFHEYGHCLQTPLTPKQKYMKLSKEEKVERETEAWDIAREKLRQYDFFQTHIDSFEQYREMRISNYESE